MRSLMDMYKVNQDDIIIEIIKRPKEKPTHKFKIDESTYYLYDNEDEINIFCYKQYKVSKVTNGIVIQRFKKTLKDKHYLVISGLYNDKLNEFNGEEFLHSQYITSTILDEVYKYL